MYQTSKYVGRISLLLFLWHVTCWVGAYAQQQYSAESIKTGKGLQEKEYSSIMKSIDVFSAVLKELDLFYVDTVDVEKAMQVGVEAMLNSLDPYTTYIPEEMMDDFKLMTTGEYAGVGAIIAYKDGRVVINELYEGLPAAKAGLKVGDVILGIDNDDVTKFSVAQVSERLRGLHGSEILITVQRPGDDKSHKIRVVRENIHINSVPYYGILSDSTGYIALSSFIEQSGQEVRQAFEELKRQGITSLILDLRDNGGGILESAIDIVSMFVPKGSVVLSTKGKVTQWDRVYRSTSTPIDTDIPLAILVNKNSASASEIVAGSLQDLDRAVIIGSRTFGKGLVQTTRQLPFRGSIKLTISKYYTPSGRCVQALDYSHRNSDGSVGRVPDSLTTVFHTVAGRPVRDGGGIIPDVVISPEKTPSILYYLVTQYVVFDYVNSWVRGRTSIAPVQDFVLSEADYQGFKDFVKEKNITYEGISQKSLEALKEMMEIEGYTSSAESEYQMLKEKLKPNLQRDLEVFKPDIIRLINNEIIRRYYFKKGEVIESLKWDKIVPEAIAILRSPRYGEILSTP